jgi:hypothetical protein
MGYRIRRAEDVREEDFSGSLMCKETRNRLSASNLR